MASPSIGVWELVRLGATNVGCLVVGLVLGLLADKQFDALPTYTLVGLAAGIICGVAVTYARIRNFLHG